MRKTLIALAVLGVSRIAAADVDLSIAVDAPDQVVAGSNVTYTITVTNDDTDAASPFVVTDELPPEAIFVSCSATGGGVCGSSGTIRTISFDTLAGGASATITIVANVDCSVTDQSDTVNIAEIHPGTADPDADEVDNDSAAFTVVRIAISNVSATPSMLWPPNHNMVNVSVDYTITDNCGPVTVTLSVASNEPVNATGDGNTAPDWQVVTDHLVQLRAERAGSGTGRIYTITITATDSAGASASANVTVSVPHDKR